MSIRQASIGVDIGGTKIAAAVVDIDGHILSSLKAITPEHSAEEVIAAVENIISQLFEFSPRRSDVIGIGLGVAGTVDWDAGLIVQSPNLPLSDVRLRGMIEAKYGLPTFMDNDANLATLGEKYYGSAREAENVVGLTLGTGIGAGILFDGCLYRGATGSAAELGHMVVQANGPQCTCGSFGCFEEMASGRALVRTAKEKLEQGQESILLELAHGSADAITGPLITEAAQRGDQLALESFREIGYWLGIGLNSIINIFNPDLVVIGGGMAESGELILAPAREVIRERTLHPNQDVVDVVLAELGNQAGSLGAAALVFDELSL